MHVAGRGLGNERFFRTGMLYWLNQFFLELDTYNFIIFHLLDKTINLIFFKFELFRSDYFIKTIIYTELITSCFGSKLNQHNSYFDIHCTSSYTYEGIPFNKSKTNEIPSTKNLPLTLLKQNWLIQTITLGGRSASFPISTRYLSNSSSRWLEVGAFFNSHAHSSLWMIYWNWWSTHIHFLYHTFNLKLS